MQCPKCQGLTYDNRAENDARLAKGEKMRPDFKCKDKACDGVVWRPKEGWGAGVPASAAKVATTKEAHSIGGPLPWEKEDTLPLEKLDGIFRVYDVCFDHAFDLAHRKMGNDCTHEGIAAQAATLFITARDKGIG